MGKLIAIDGNSLLHRAYYALPSMTTHAGQPTGAVYGFLGMLLKLLSEEPDYLLVAFDMHTPTFRHEMYDQYKAGRKPTPDDLRAQFPLLKELLHTMKIAVVECERYEADDILGTFSRIANEAGVDALLVTGDRDALQLVREHTHVMLTKKGITETEEYDPALLKERYGLTPEHMIDLKGLMGDTSDHIPGVPGVGEKTALRLLGDYGTLEGTLAHADEVPGKLGERLREFADQARLSYRLGTIDMHAPVTQTLSDCAFHKEALENAVPRLSELDMRTLVLRFSLGETKNEPKEEIPVEELPITNEEELRSILPELQSASLLAVTMGEGMTLATDENREYAVRFEGTLLDPGLTPQDALCVLAPVLSADTPKKVLFDAKKIMHILRAEGITLGAVDFDAMIADYLLNATKPADSLESLCGDLLGSKCAGAARLLRISSIMKKELRKRSLDSLFQSVELPLTRVLFDMECIGFRVDEKILHDMSGEFAAQIEALLLKIEEAAGVKFNPNSPKQLGSVLFETLGLPAQKKNKNGYSTGADVLEKLQDRHPVVPMVLEYRFLTKLKSTFLDGLLSLTDEHGRIHSRFNQNVAATGRISSAEPNLQNIPVRTAVGREIRRAFIASEGNLLVDADYSQIELRLLAHMSGDENMIRAFQSGGDIHRSTAAEVFGVSLDEVTKEQRSAAKAVNFGIVYGISEYGLAKNLGISRKKAGEYISRYFLRYPGVKAYLDGSIAAARKNGYAQTLLGRRREMPELKSGNRNTSGFGERVAMNMPLQGTAADIIKIAMIRVHDAFEKEELSAKLILQIHDELIVDTPENEVEAVKKILRREMENVLPLKVPLIADVNVGKSWFDTK